ncbi:MAG TPA: hypothetical protein VMI54_07580 [Polyangiaceae bacterium]|nr:hypothetical protein [Polyangiaceae bacterium]
MTRPARSRVRRIGRRVGIVLFALCVSVPTLLWTYQIMMEIFFRPTGPAPATCDVGLLSLLRAVDRARLAARKENVGERHSLERFRAALDPEWNSRPALDSLCRAAPENARRLREVDALRYAEEHAVRYEATALAGQRQRARELEHELETR